MITKLARDIGLNQASLRRIDTYHLAGFDWDEYILRESLIRYMLTWHITF
jgi:hypothetical protein